MNPQRTITYAKRGDYRLEFESVIDYMDSTDTAEWDNRLRLYDSSMNRNMYVRMEEYQDSSTK